MECRKKWLFCLIVLDRSVEADKLHLIVLPLSLLHTVGGEVEQMWVDGITQQEGLLISELIVFDPVELGV